MHTLPLALALSLALAVPTPLSPAVLASALPERPAVQAQESAPESPRIYPSSPEGAPAAYELRLPVLMYHHVIPGWQECNEMTVTVERLEQGYDSLPRQLIHRDVHFENFLFYEGRLSGYIDFDLSQHNIRIFDICYFLAGLLAEEMPEPFTKEEWIKDVRAAVAGYESIEKFSREEKEAIPCVMECIEILFAAYSAGLDDAKGAEAAYGIFRFIQGCEGDIDK